jgi:hypothetical protein
VTNQLSISLSNEAMARGLELARARGASSLEELIELVLLEGTAASPASPARAERAASQSADSPALERGAAGKAAHFAPASQITSVDFAINPPTLTLEPPQNPPGAPLAAELPPSTLPLPFLTNRVSPLKASVRALGNLAAGDGAWPRLRDFQARAGHAARERGMQLRAEDRAAGRRGRAKRSVAWPIGANPVTALERYAFAFTLALDGGVPTGPLATLGLATVIDGRAALTEHGWELATAPSPVLDSGEGTMSPEDVAILRERVLHSPPERAAISEFLRATRRAAGAQSRIDELLATWHADWSADQAAAQRSAMIGRLEELKLLDVTGRGSHAVVRLGDVEDFEHETSQRSAA